MPKGILLDHTGNPIKSGRTQLVPVRDRRSLRARYDAAQTTTDNSRHWANADDSSAISAADPTVRKVLRRRARYEAQENNSYAKGIALTLANDTIGKGPRLQLHLDNRDANRWVEREFGMWSRTVNLAGRLRALRMAKFIDGEGISELITNPRLRHPVKLDLSLIEAELLTSDLGCTFDKNKIDGIDFDESGNPITYHVAKEHPADSVTVFPDTRSVKPEYMIHLFREDRPGQKRGIPEITPALPLFAQLRRYTLAVLSAAETAADFAGVMYTDSNALADDDIPDLDPLDAIELERNMLTTLPMGWKLAQMKAEQPATTYEMFKREILNEIARCLNMPSNIATMSSANHNYSSGKLDHQVYQRSIEIERDQIEIMALDRIFSLWIYEASLLSGYLPSGLEFSNYVPHSWFWDGFAGVEPLKEANALAVKLKIGAINLEEYFASQGKDVEIELEKFAKTYDVSIGEAKKILLQNIMSVPDQIEDEDEKTTDEKK